MPNGRLADRHRHPNGRNRSKTFSRKQDAQDFLDDTPTDARRGEWIPPSDASRRGSRTASPPAVLLTLFAKSGQRDVWRSKGVARMQTCIAEEHIAEEE
jgi:hypothetical protein